MDNYTLPEIIYQYAEKNTSSESCGIVLKPLRAWKCSQDICSTWLGQKYIELHLDD